MKCAYLHRKKKHVCRALTLKGGVWDGGQFQKNVIGMNGRQTFLQCKSGNFIQFLTKKYF